MKESIPELLAPAGHVEGFLAAVENGADAVYLGLKQLSARATAVNFTLEELAQLVPFARSRQVSVYVALNSLVAAGPVQPEDPGPAHYLYQGLFPLAAPERRLADRPG